MWIVMYKILHWNNSLYNVTVLPLLMNACKILSKEFLGCTEKYTTAYAPTSEHKVYQAQKYL